VLQRAPVSPYQLVIFDCDGVLVDSERVTNQVFADMLGELGLAFTLDDMFEHFMGRSMAYCLARITELLGAPPPAGFEPDYRRRTKIVLATVTAIAGIEAVLDQLALPYCVASNGPREKMQISLTSSGLWSRVEGKLFSAYEVANPKPAPDLFLHAAAHHGIAPEACVVIEDSPTGVAAGVAAGMTVLGYTASMPAHRLREAGAHQLFDRMADLPALLTTT
jgi:HAD superfamily hydrolase (TIGR01509 family)